MRKTIIVIASLCLFLLWALAMLGIFLGDEQRLQYEKFINQSPHIIALFIITFLLALGSLLFASFFPLLENNFKQRKLKKHLRQYGIKGMAAVLSIKETGIMLNNYPYIKVNVEVKPGIQGDFLMILSPSFFLRPGDQIEVVYNPSNPTEVLPAGLL